MQKLIEQTLHELENGSMSRRQAAARLGKLFLLAAGAGPLLGNEPGDAAGPTFQATELNHIALRVSDVARSKDFYIKHLGLTVSSESANSAFLNCGNHFVALFRGDTPSMDHYCYSVKNYSAGSAVELLREAGLADVRRSGNRVYFSDPDRLTVQVAAGD